jgi:glycosyltransferase involved in cell wall biosynthesis
VRLLEVLPTYPGDPFDGSAVYERNLNRALVEHGARIEVLTTRAQKLRHDKQFLIRWPDELPRLDEHAGIKIRRFHALDTGRAGELASDSVSRRWSRESFSDGELVNGSATFTEAVVAEAQRRPSRFDTLADFGRGPLVPSLLAHLARRASKFDAIIAGYAPFSLSRQVLWAARLSGVPVALLPFIHESDRFHQFTSLLGTYQRAAAVLTLSDHTTAFLNTYVPGANAVTLGAGVTTASDGAISATEFRRRHGLAGMQIVLYVGRKEKSKRYDLAVAAMEAITGDAVLVMVGRDVDGKPLGSDRVRHLGPLPDDELAGAYAACDVFVLPSEFESFGMVFLDAWLRCKPVIGNLSCGAAASLIDDGVDGYLCRDAREIAAALTRLLGDPALRARMGAAGREKTVGRYTWPQVAERALQALARMTDDSTRHRRSPTMLE